MEWLEEQLKRYFGYNEFREHQKEIVEAVLARKDVLAILPTGAGKSICYQLPAMLMEGVAVIISPLISLMQDQVVSLSRNGLSAAFLNSSLPYDEIQSVLNNLKEFKLLYVAPERFADKNFVQRLKQSEVSLFAIDEAHCISQWGHSFRPDYRQLSLLKKEFPASPVVALTATATSEVKNDIATQLSMKEPFIVKASFDRPNLTFLIQLKKDPISQIREFLTKHPDQPGIIYAATRNTVDETYTSLLQEGFKVGKYHAGLSDGERSRAQHDFVHGECLLMVATVAFGMGIHKPDIRFVAHLDMPRTIEQYYQEVGRAGRDGLASECLMLYSPQDLKIYQMFSQKIEDEALRQTAKDKTDKMYFLAKSTRCRRKELLRYFGETYAAANCGGCDNCLDNTELSDETIAAQKILSCVFRLNQRFGVKYVIDVLRGSKSKEIYERNHDRLSTYNLMADTSEAELRYIIDVLIEKRLLERSDEEYPVLRWTELSQSVTRGAEKVMMRKKIERSAPARKRGEDMQCDQELFLELSQLRKKFAQEAQVPAFVIFGDRSLIEMSKIYPKTREAMMQINGVGPVKWVKYGHAFLEAIKAHCAKRFSTPQK
ncbi:MAG: DNA helicase RecQ [Verrucomicrobia bacterium]|nr:DNA helicase RecQ [Verrucomicrobiota bacterium]